MYRFLKLESLNNEFYVVYTRQNDYQRHSVLRRNAHNGMKGKMYDFMRRVTPERTSLFQINNERCFKNITTLSEAKVHRLFCEKVLLEEVTEKLKLEVEELEEDNEEMKENMGDDINKLIDVTIHNNNESIRKKNIEIEEFQTRLNC